MKGLYVLLVFRSSKSKKKVTSQEDLCVGFSFDSKNFSVLNVYRKGLMQKLL